MAHSASKLVDFSTKLLTAAGAPDAVARAVSESLVAADLRGVSSHGVVRLGVYLKRMAEGIEAQTRQSLANLGHILKEAGYDYSNVVKTVVLLDSIAAVVIGGASLFGGSGTILGTVAGSLVIAVIQYGLVFIDVAPFWQFVAVGVVIIISVLVDQTQRKLGGDRT